METERIELNARERERLKVLQQVEEGHLKQVEAARRLRLSVRIRRLQARLHSQGDRGIVHRSRGHRSNRKIPEAWRAGVMRQVRWPHDAGFGPTITGWKQKSYSRRAAAKPSAYMYGGPGAVASANW